MTTDKTTPPTFGIGLRSAANLISYLFHPIFVPLYVVAFMLFIHPLYFAGFEMSARKQTLLIVSVNLVFFPLLSVVLLKKLGFIESIFLRTSKDRIIPYIASGIFFFWGYLVFKNQAHYPLVLRQFILGMFLASSAALMCNIYFKVSMHAIGIGGALGLFLWMLKSSTMLMSVPIAITIFIAGLICTSRFLLNSHSQKEVYAGLVVGIAAQLAAAWWCN